VEIKLKNLQGGYGKKIIIQEASCSFPSNKITSIVGKNGCGKSTLLQLCMGFLPIVGGEVYLGSENLSNMKRKKIASHIAYLSQIQLEAYVKVKDLVAYGRYPYLGYARWYSEQDKKIIKEAMKKTGCEQYAEANIKNLSGGERQKVYLSMCLAQDTPVLFLDEPITYLDIHYQLEFMRLLKKLKAQGKTIVMVLHDINLAFKYSDHIVVLDKGKTIYQGTPQEVVKNKILQELFQVNIAYSEVFNQYFVDLETT
jgi:iron complex transport system ATP-binding protein